MAGLGLTWVRIGEFAWSRLEPEPGQLDFGWLDRAIDTLGAVGLRVVLGTPTATPPRWVLDRHPDMLAVDAEGRARGFGSRRHYCFSHAGYLEECRRIVTLLAERYGRNPNVAAWQTDNEYGCHDTVLSFSDAARDGFRAWLRGQFPGGNDGDIGALNRAWGNVFWSMEYRTFDEIGLPNLTVTEPNPAHVLAFRRYASDQVVRFNRAQVEIIRAHSDAPVAHNYMGGVTDFDHFAVGAELDISSWDSYPLGFLEDRVGATPEHQRAFARQGDPDYQAFHHDLYRAVGQAGPLVGDGAAARPGELGALQPGPLAGDGAAVDMGGFRARGRGGVVLPLAAGALRAGAASRRPSATRQRRGAGVSRGGRGRARNRGRAGCRAGAGAVALVFDYASDWAWRSSRRGGGFPIWGWCSTITARCGGPGFRWMSCRPRRGISRATA